MDGQGLKLKSESGRDEVMDGQKSTYDQSSQNIHGAQTNIGEVKGSVISGYVQTSVHVPDRVISINDYKLWATRVDNKIDRKEIYPLIYSWLKKNLFVNRAILRDMHLKKGDFIQVYWPISYYQSRYLAHYVIDRIKPKNQKIRYGSGTMETVEIEMVSKSIKPLNIALLVQVDAVPLNSQQASIIEKALLALNNLGPKQEFRWSGNGYWALLLDFSNTIKEWLLTFFREANIALNQGLYDPRPVYPPKLNRAKKLFILSQGLKHSPPEADTLHISENHRSSIREQCRNIVIQEFNKALLQASEQAYITESIFSNELLLPYYYPFWIVETNVNDEVIQFVLSGVDGTIMYTCAPAGRFMKVILVLIMLLVIGFPIVVALLLFINQ